MLVQLTVRNVLRNLSRLAPLVIIIIAVFLTMLVGNAILSASGEALYGVYGALLAGDLSVSADAETNFTIFGSDQLLVGEYLILDVIHEFEHVQTTVEALHDVRATAGLVSATARVQINGQERTQTLFGVDFAEYRELFPDIALIAGAFPEPSEPGIVIQEHWLADEDAAAATLGRSALLTSGRGRTFTLREVPVTGVFRYPVDDALLSTIALIDADTARTLNGYLYGALEEVDLSAEDARILDAEVDTLFGESDTSAGTSRDAGEINLGNLLGTRFDTARTERARETIAGTWNFLLVALHDRGDRQAVLRELEAANINENDEYRVRSWWSTIGGNASLVRYLQVLFNAGLVFVAFGAAIIATNALVLSVLERTNEIGTMRALGATRVCVALLITFETVLVVVSAAVLGIISGAIVVRMINAAEYNATNQFIQILFGGGPIIGFVSGRLVLMHLAAALLLSLIAVVYPIKQALVVSPREAMAA